MFGAINIVEYAACALLVAFSYSLSKTTKYCTPRSGVDRSPVYHRADTKKQSFTPHLHLQSIQNQHLGRRGGSWTL